MSILLADIDATCSALGIFTGDKYIAEPDALQGLKHIIWILRRDTENSHEYRRYLGHKKVIQTDLIPMLIDYCDNPEYADVLLRLLVNLTNPALLLYREELPKDGPGRRNFLDLIDILQGYKEAFTRQSIWAVLGARLQKVLEIDWSERSEEQGLLIERILALARNVLQVPASPDTEKRSDNDASVHDQVLWALQQSGVLDLILYILGSENENQYHLHALEITYLMYREQTAVSLADASLQRSAVEKHRDEQELVTARKREKSKLVARPPPARHSRFGGTFVMQNLKSVSDNDLICHQPLDRAIAMDFDREKKRVKRSFRIVKETEQQERRSAFSVRLFLREFCIEILQSAYNTLVRQVRRVLERNSTSSTTGHDDSYLLWAIRFFMEFNRLSGLQIDFVSETLSVQCFHWVTTRIEHDFDMLTSDKTRSRIWARRLHIGVQTYRELLESLNVLQKRTDEKSQTLFSVLQNNVFYVLEYREIILHLLISFNESHSTKAYLRDVIETTNLFFKMMEKYCQGTVRVQNKKKNRRQNKKGAKKQQHQNKENIENLDDIWARMAPQISTVLANNSIILPEEEHPRPFDAASDIPIDDQKEDCMIRIHNLLREEKYEHAIILMRSAREVWPENDCFGVSTAAPEDEFLIMREIFSTDLEQKTDKTKSRNANEFEAAGQDNASDDDEEEEEEDALAYEETDFRFEDFVKRLVNPKVVRACIIVLSDWEKITTRALKSAVTVLHRIAVFSKMPEMLYQASLFRIFQRVFHSPKEVHNEELKRLGVHIVRCFVAVAPNNPKIYADLLCFKTIRDAENISSGYVDDYSENNKKGPKGTWNEQQEEELRGLFMENQTNPTNEKDVIDWILDNLIDSNRTRRSVIKKLKELGLIFKAPTRKSLAAQVNKNHWNREQDEQLRNLWDENRMSENVLEILMEVFSQQNRSQNNLINRMMQIGLIANRSEILPDKPKKSRAPKTSGQGAKKVPKKAKPTNRKLNVKKIKELLTGIEENLKTGLEWLIESFNDAAEDFEEVSEDPEDCIPLVPILAPQYDAIDNPQFQSLLQEIGVQESDSYWRIPGTFNADELKLRADILSGAEIEEDLTGADESDDDIQNNTAVSCDSNSEDEVDDNQFAAWRQKITNNLIYNKSDDEERAETHKPVKRASKKSKDTFDKLKSKSNENEDDLCEGNSQSLRSRLAELTNSSDTSDGDDGANIDKSPKKNKANSKAGGERKRMKRIMIDSSDSEIDDGNKSAAVIATDSGDEERVCSEEISRNSNNDAREENSNQSSNSNGEIDTNPINKSTSSSSIVAGRTAVATEEAAVAAEMETNENSGGDDKGVDGSSETSAEKMVIAGDKKKRDRSYLSDSSDDSSSIQNKKHKNHSRRLVLSDDDDE